MVARDVQMWAVIIPGQRGDRISYWSVRRTRKQAIAALVGPYDMSGWPRYRKQGYRVTRVTVSEVQDD